HGPRPLGAILFEDACARLQARQPAPARHRDRGVDRLSLAPSGHRAARAAARKSLYGQAWRALVHLAAEGRRARRAWLTARSVARGESSAFAACATGCEGSAAAPRGREPAPARPGTAA